MRKHRNVHITGSRIFKCNRCKRSFCTYKADKCYFCEEEGESQNLDLVDHHNSAIKPVMRAIVKLKEPETIIKEAEGSLKNNDVNIEEATDTFRCFMCGKSVFSDLELQMHVQVYHKKQKVRNGSNSHSSSLGNSDFDSDLDSDADDLPKKFKCTQCPKAFRSKLFCEQHIAQHFKTT